MKVMCLNENIICLITVGLSILQKYFLGGCEDVSEVTTLERNS